MQKNKFVKEIDAWVKQIRREHSEVIKMKDDIYRNIDNTEHHYELITEVNEKLNEAIEHIVRFYYH